VAAIRSHPTKKGGCRRLRRAAAATVGPAGTPRPVIRTLSGKPENRDRDGCSWSIREFELRRVRHCQVKIKLKYINALCQLLECMVGDKNGSLLNCKTRLLSGFFALCVVLFQIYISYDDYRANGVIAIADDLIFVYIGVMLFIGIVSGIIRSAKFNIYFSVGGIIVLTISYVLKQAEIKIYGSILFFIVLSYYIFIILYR